MIDTNALLSIAFTLISNFTQVVEVPYHAVPQKTADLESCLIGSPSSPCDLYMVHRKGTEFWIADGVVWAYRSPGSYFNLQDAHLIPKFTGDSALSSNSAIELAATTLRRLIRDGDPLTNGPPRVLYPSSKRIPFYEVTWPKGNGGLTPTAKVEIDGRTGTIVALNLWDHHFRDPALAQQIKNRVCRPDPVVAPPLKAPRKRVLPYPSKEQAAQAIRNWLLFCQRLGLDPGSNTDLSQIDWEKSSLYAERQISPTIPVCRITFTNKAIFESVGGVVFNHFGSDAFFTNDYLDRPRSAWDAIHGVVAIRWEELADALQRRICQQFKVSPTTFDMLRPFIRNGSADQGKDGLTRTVIDWRRLRAPHLDDTVSVEEFPRVFAAEFDLRTGETKFIAFYDLSLICAPN